MVIIPTMQRCDAKSNAKYAAQNYCEIFLTSGYGQTYEMDIEAYAAGYMNDKNYRSEIWIPVVKK